MQKKKGLALVLSFALVACLGVAGVLAWLTDDTETIENTFTVGDIDITLQETDLETGEPIYAGGNEYQMIPGTTYRKDPVVTVAEGSEKCYLFVKFEEIGNPADYLDYISKLTEDDGWDKLTGVDGVNNVWYRTVDASEAELSFQLLANDKITVNAQKVTEDNMEAAAQAKLAYTAYAIQTANMADANAAWTALQGQINA